MENQHHNIKDYRELSAEEIALMNRIKEQGDCLESMIYDLFLNESTDLHWFDIAQSHLQQGIMAAVRSIAKPDSF